MLIRQFEIITKHLIASAMRVKNTKFYSLCVYICSTWWGKYFLFQSVSMSVGLFSRYWECCGTEWGQNVELNCLREKFVKFLNWP